MKEKEMKNTTTRDWLSGKMMGSLLTALFLLLASPSFAQDLETVSVNAEEEFNEWDVDDDNQWTEDEFGTAFDNAGLFDEWDEDDDDFLTDEEFAVGFFTVYDIDDDDTWSKEEFNTWATALGKDFDYSIWDTNDDGVVDSGEFSEAVKEAGIYKDYDSDNDGLYIEDEVTKAIFSVWDVNDDDFLDYNEYETYGYGLW